MENLKSEEEVVKYFEEKLKPSKKQYCVKAIKNHEKFYVMECIVDSYDQITKIGYLQLMGFTYINGENTDQEWYDLKFNFENGNIDDVVENQLAIYEGVN